MPAHVEIELCGTQLWLLADRALYHAKRQGKNNASYGE